MKVLIDTNVMLWWLGDHERLAPYREVLADHRNEVYFSAVSVAEVSIKVGKGRLTVPDVYVEKLEQGGFVELPFLARHGLGMESLPAHHKDPFDRMIIAQALTEGFPVMTADAIFREYGVQVL